MAKSRELSQRKARVQRSARSTRECIVAISFQDKEVLTITVGLRWNIRVQVQKRLVHASCTIAYLAKTFAKSEHRINCPSRHKYISYHIPSHFIFYQYKILLLL